MCMSLAKKTTDSSQCLGTVQKAKALCRLWSKMKDPVDMDLCQPLTLIYPNIVIFQADQVPVCIIRRISSFFCCCFDMAGALPQRKQLFTLGLYGSALGVNTGPLGVPPSWRRP